MRQKNILVTNDDGISAEGIRVLAAALPKSVDVYVCAPDRQRTASGHGITVSEDLYLTEASFAGAKKAFACSGTPADCVKLGLKVFRSMGIGMDLVCSGINHGANLGTDVLYSGTVSAAIEGVICGIPSVAFSLCSHEAKHFEVFEELVPSVCQAALAHLSGRTVLNVNAPDIPQSEIAGLKIARLGAREYADAFNPTPADSGRTYYSYSSEAVVYEDLPEDVDVMAFQNNYVTITPLQYDLTNHDLLEEVAGWGIGLKR